MPDGPRQSASASRGRPSATSRSKRARVDGVRRDREPVAAGRGLQHVADAAPQPRHERLERVLLVGRKVVVPHGVDERARGDRAARVQRQPCQQRAQATAAELDGLAVALHPQRPEDVDPDRGSVGHGRETGHRRSVASAGDALVG